MSDFYAARIGWLAWVTEPDNKINKPQGRLSEYWWRDDKFYFSNTPVGRALTHKGKLVVLSTQSDSPVDNKAVSAVLRVPHLGIFSKYEGDWLDGDPMHERIRYCFYLEIKFRLAEVEKQADVNFATVTDDHIEATGWVNGIKTLMRSYDRYDQVFERKWGPLPSLYVEQMRETILFKRDRYMDPKLVAKRERAKARKEAVKALDIGGDN